MKRIYCILFFTVLLVGTALAQDSLQVTPELMGTTITARIDREVELTEKQKQKVYLLLLERSKNYDQVEKTFKGKKAKIKNEKENIDIKAKEKFEKILTKEQLENYYMLKAQDEGNRNLYKKDKSYYLSEEDEELDF